jgi:hypothetical protein
MRLVRTIQLTIIVMITLAMASYFLAGCQRDYSDVQWVDFYGKDAESYIRARLSDQSTPLPDSLKDYRVETHEGWIGFFNSFGPFSSSGLVFSWSKPGAAFNPKHIRGNWYRCSY